MNDLLEEFEVAAKVYKELYAKKEETEIKLNTINQELARVHKFLLDTLSKKLESGQES